MSMSGGVYYPRNFIGPVPQPKTTVIRPENVKTSNQMLLGSSTGPSGGGSNAGAPQPPAGLDLQRDDIQNQLDAGNDQIERDYQDFLGQLGTQEEQAQRNYGLAKKQTTEGYTGVVNQLQNEQASKLGTLQEQEQKATSTTKSELQSARDLYNQLQQENIARLSATGLSSSSVAEALAENLGRETARRIASVSQNANDIYANIDRERKNIKDYVAGKMTELEQQKQAQLDQLQNGLMTAIENINMARNTAAKDKANLRQDLLTRAQTAASQIQQQTLQFQQDLAQWEAKNSAKLNAAANTDYEAILKNVNTNIGNIQNLLGDYPGLQADYNVKIPEFGQVSISPKKQQEEELGPLERAILNQQNQLNQPR